MRIRKASLAAVLSVCGSTLLCASIASGIEDDKVGIVRHYIDTATDRVPARTAFPRYPSIARRDRIEGEATVCFKIRANGRISRPVVTDYSHRIFSKPALRAIKNSSFEPLGPGQILDTARSCRTYRFRLEPVLADNDAAGIDDLPE